MFISRFDRVVGHINSIDRIIVNGGDSPTHFNPLIYYYPDVFETVENSQLSNVQVHKKIERTTES